MDVFARKLRTLSEILEEDIEALADAASDMRIIPAGTDIISEGDDPQVVHLILSGLACRYKFTDVGRRQIFGYLLPGDFCDLHVALLPTMDHSIGALSPSKVARLSRQKVLDLLENHQRISRALWLCSLVDSATLREWLLNVGQRAADERIAHLFCEVHERLAVVGLASAESFDLPITQNVLADTVGLSDVHVNRSLRSLREAGLVIFREHVVTIPDVTALRAFAGFDPTYLHLRRESRGKLSPSEN